MSAHKVAKNVAFPEECAIPLLPAANADFDRTIGTFVQNEGVLVRGRTMPFGRRVNVRCRGIESCSQARGGALSFVRIISWLISRSRFMPNAYAKAHR